MKKIEDILNQNFPDDDISMDCLEKAISEMRGSERPGEDLLPENKRRKYVRELKKKLKEKLPEKKKFSKAEVKALWTRHLLDIIVHSRNSEFDILVTLKVDNIF